MRHPSQHGTPVLARRDGPGLELERVNLTPKGNPPFDEAWLQKLIHSNPACLPFADIEPGLGAFSPICREMSTPRGWLDNLLMTGAGDIAVVEVKLFRNFQARREAVAQLLDYATGIFEMSFSNFESCVLTGTFDPLPKPTRLYDALPKGDKSQEKEFCDAVSRNLRLGRATLIVAGDGIRSEAEDLLNGMNLYSRFGFTLSLVELAVFRMPDSAQFLVQPRTLAKTAIVQRSIIEITHTGQTVREETPVVPESVAIANYWERLEARTPGAKAALEKLIKSAEPLGVYPEFLASLNLKWGKTRAKSVNLGYIFKDTSVFSDTAFVSVPTDLAKRYVEDFAATFGCDVHVYQPGSMTPYKNGAPLRLSAILYRIEDWLGPIERFIKAIEEHDRSAEEG